MTEFKKLVNDARLETAELPWTTIQSLFIKANALKSNAAHFQRRDEAGTALTATPQRLAAIRATSAACI